MNSIFANKSLLDAEYKRLFLKKLTHIEELKESIRARYDKKTVSDETIRQILSNNHKVIYEFIGAHNESRIRHFFADFQKQDNRDNQIRIADRFILDCIHFDVIFILMTRFATEYSTDQADIDKEWNNEIQSAKELGAIPPFLIIQNAIKLNKERVFNELVFPDDQRVTLFQLKKNSVIPDRAVFINWLSESNQKSNGLRNTLLYLSAAVVASLCMMLPFIFGTPEAMILTGASMIANLTAILPAIITLVLIASLGGVIYWSGNHSNTPQGDNINSIPMCEGPVIEVHTTIDGKNNQETPEAAPFHNTRWSLSGIPAEVSLSSYTTTESKGLKFNQGL